MPARRDPERRVRSPGGAALRDRTTVLGIVLSVIAAVVPTAAARV